MEVLFTDINDKTIKVDSLNHTSIDNLRSTLNYWYKYDIYGPSLTWMFHKGCFYINNYNENIIEALKASGFCVYKLKWKDI